MLVLKILVRQSCLLEARHGSCSCLEAYFSSSCRYPFLLKSRQLQKCIGNYELGQLLLAYWIKQFLIAIYERTTQETADDHRGRKLHNQSQSHTHMSIES